MREIEFYTDHSSGQAMYRISGNPHAKELTSADREVIKELLERSKVFYPEQYKALSHIYSKYQKNKIHYDFIRVRRLINCCFGEIDAQPDIDQLGNYNFEFVKCPLLGECEYHQVICHPKLNSRLSQREKDVMGYYMGGFQTKEIAAMLFISPNTVANHRKNSYRKLNIHSLGEFVNYAHLNKLYTHGTTNEINEP